MDPPDLIDMNTVLDNTSHAMLEDDIPHVKGKLLVCLDWGVQHAARGPLVARHRFWSGPR